MMIGVPRSEILQKVFAISVDQVTCGSAFAQPIAGGHCFITAKHVLANRTHGSNGNIFIFKDGRWHEAMGTFYFCADPIDVAIVRTSIPSTDDGDVELTLAGAQYGQDAHFLGFPYFGSSVEYKSSKANEGFPMPFVKKCTISAFADNKIYFDGHNNPGFSGGPVTFWDYREEKQKVCGVISGYLNHFGEIETIPTSSRLFYGENSGIGVAYNIKHAVDLINMAYGKMATAA